MEITGLPVLLRPDDRASLGSCTGGTNYESGESMGADNVKKKVRHLQVSPDDLRRLKEKLDGKKSSLRKTYKTNKEANDNVFELNQKMGMHLETHTLSYSNFDSARAERKEAEEQFDKDFKFLL